MAYSDEHFWSTLATVKYIGNDVGKNPVVLNRAQNKVGIQSDG